MNGKLVDRIRHALVHLGGQAHLDEIYREVKRISDAPMTGAWENSISGEIHRHSSDSESYQNGPNYFYSVEGKGKGVWGLREGARPYTIDDL